MRKTKIIGTIGPSSRNYNTLKKLVLAGLNVCRINMSHDTFKDHQPVFDIVKRLRKELNKSIPIMLDTRGPEIRIKTFENGEVELKRGQTFKFVGYDVEGNQNIVSITAPEIISILKPKQKILAANGLLEFKVIEIKNDEIVCKVLNTAILSNRKSLSFPGVKFNTPYINEKDKNDIIWGIKNGVDYIAASFVNCKEDILALKKLIAENNGHCKIISKIESSFAIDNLDEIIEESYGIMVARGDLGVEMPIPKLPELQKLIIKKSKDAGKICITATEMLESMIHNPRPTRAETTDVANAVYDGTGALMLSAETAAGNFPVESVRYMSSIAEETEKHISYDKRFHSMQFTAKNITDVVSNSAVNASFQQKTKAIVVFTNTGECARMVARFRPKATIVAATPDEVIFRQLDLLWGVAPVFTPMYETTDEMFDMANRIVKDFKIAKPNDIILITSGTPKTPGHTNLIKLDIVK